MISVVLCKVSQPSLRKRKSYDGKFVTVKCSNISDGATLTKEELSTSNTDETHRKVSLDKNKLNCLKALVIAKFPTESSEEKDRFWRAIKGKINTKCRANIRQD